MQEFVEANEANLTKNPLKNSLIKGFLVFFVAVSLLGLAVFIYNKVFAASVSWDGGAGTSNWGDALNWSNDTVPTTTDDVIINTAVTVNINASTTVKSLTLGVSGGGTASVLNFNYDAVGINAPLTMTGDLTVYSGATITHMAATTSEVIVGRINLSVGGNATITGSINADAKGYRQSEGPGQGSDTASNISAPGGSYGGIGGTPASGITATGSYGSLTQPIDLGSGGGIEPGGVAGAGGGAIKIEVTGTVTLTGTISANGGAGSSCNYPGGGSGGSIYLTTATLSGAGGISAYGGAGCSTTAGGGGGGRIAVYYTTDNSTLTYNNYGGTAVSSATTGIGGAGTTYKKSTSQSYGDLIVDNANIGGVNELIYGRTALLSSTVFDSLTIQRSASFYLIASSATTTNLNITTGGHYNALEDTKLNHTNLFWTGANITANKENQSAVLNAIDNDWTTYWASSQGFPYELQLAYETALNVNQYQVGINNSTGDAAKNWTFDGWNGSSWVTLDTQTNQTGWTAYSTRTYNFTATSSFSTFRLNITANNGGGWTRVAEIKIGSTNTGIYYGGGGIIYDSGGTLSVLNQNQDLVVPYYSRLVFNVATSSSASLRTYNNLTINGTLTHSYNSGATTATTNLYKLNWTINGSLTVNASGSINVDYRGYPASEGPGSPVDASEAGGGSYGGKGGDSIVGIASSTYGSLTAPLDLGSGGGNDSNQGATTAGSGGGAVKFSVTGTTTVTGTISANGQNGVWCYQAGGGSGGSVYLITGTLAGSGSLSVYGGNACTSGSPGSGGGGRIAVYYTTDNSSISYTTRGGTNGYQYGGSGTLYKKATSQTYGDLILNNNGLGGSDERYLGKTPLGFSSLDSLTFDSITATSSAFFYLASSTASTLTASATTITLSGNGMYEAVATSTLSYSTLNWTGGMILDSGGTILVLNQNQDLTVPAGTKLIFNVATSSSASLRTYNNLTIDGTLTHSYNTFATTGTASLYKINWTIIGSLTVNSGGGINVDGRGYIGARGPGAPAGATQPAGASYGGQGGAGGTGAATGTYGSLTAPTDLGSGGGQDTDNTGAVTGGNGGGAIILNVTATTTILGTISANGNGAAACWDGAGGSGGSIYIIADGLTGTGTVRANGGSQCNSGGGGGGGRIATIFNKNPSNNITRTVNGGGSARTGSAGTVYPENDLNITTQTATNVRDTSATLNGTISGLGWYGITQHGFVWSTTTGPTLGVNLGFTQFGVKSATGTFASNLTNLTPTTTYYVKAYATATSTVYGNEVSFTTGAAQAFTQSEYRWYQNIDALQPVTALASENTAATITSTSSPVRLRMNFTVGNHSLLASSGTFRLQYSTSVDSGWLDILPRTDWWNTSWQNRKKITFNNASSTENLVDFPALVSLTSANVDYNKTQNSGQDIRFVDADGTTVLPYEIEKWDESAISTVWVKVPQIDALSTSDYIWMYYNNPSASDAQSATNVWNSNYRFVQHLEETSGATSTDSSANALHGTKLSATEPNPTADGQINGAQTFDGSNDYINVPDAVNPTAYTISAWVNPSNVYSRSIFVRTNASGPTVFWTHQLRITSGAKFEHYTYDGSAKSVISSTNAATSTWVYLTAIASNSGQARLYVNGKEEGTAVNVGTLQTGGTRYMIGSNSSGMNYYKGTADEVRIANTIHSASWIYAEYLNQTNSFQTYSAEDTLGSSLVWTFYDNSGAASGSTISAVLLSSSEVKGAYMESNPTALNPLEVPVGQEVEWDFVLNPIGIVLDTTYYFRLVKSGGTVFSAYTRYPAIVLQAQAPGGGNALYSGGSAPTENGSGGGSAQSGGNQGGGTLGNDHSAVPTGNGSGGGSAQSGGSNQGGGGGPSP